MTAQRSRFFPLPKYWSLEYTCILCVCVACMKVDCFNFSFFSIHFLHFLQCNVLFLQLGKNSSIKISNIFHIYKHHLAFRSNIISEHFVYLKPTRLLRIYQTQMLHSLANLVLNHSFTNMSSNPEIISGITTYDKPNCISASVSFMN